MTRRSAARRGTHRSLMQSAACPDSRPLLKNAPSLPATSLPKMTESAVMSLHYRFKAQALNNRGEEELVVMDNITASLLLGPAVLPPPLFTVGLAPKPTMILGYHWQLVSPTASDIPDSTKSLQPSTASSSLPSREHRACLGHSLHCCGCSSP